MKENNKQCINFDRCNAYSGTSYLYSAISTENSPVFAAKNKGATEPDLFLRMIPFNPSFTRQIVCDIIFKDNKTESEF